MTALALRDVSVALGGREVLHALTLAVEAGEWAALIGPNGAGKTTTLRAIAGLVPYRGRVSLGGADAADLRRRERARRIAVVPQIPVAPPDMTVGDYVLLGRTPHVGYFGREGAGDRAATAGALARLDLLAFERRAIGSLSGGERQRAVLARALAQEADVILLDEPTSALDIARQHQVLELVESLRRDDGVTVLAAMHDVTAAAAYADRLHLVSAGRIVVSGPPRDVLRDGVLSEHFGAPVRVIEHQGTLLIAAARTEAAR